MLRSLRSAAATRGLPLRRTPSALPLPLHASAVRSRSRAFASSPFDSQGSGSGPGSAGGVRWSRVLVGAVLGYAAFRGVDAYLYPDSSKAEQEAEQRRRQEKQKQAHEAARKEQAERKGQVHAPQLHGVNAAAAAAVGQPEVAKEVAAAQLRSNASPAVVASPPAVESYATAHESVAVVPSSPPAAPSSSPSPSLPASADSAPVAPVAPIDARLETDDRASGSLPTDDDDEPPFDAAWSRLDGDARRSGVPHAHPGRPYVSSLVAAQIPSRIDRRDTDVLLQLYEPWCGACKTMQPVIDTVAKVVHDVEVQGLVDEERPTGASADSGSSPVPAAPRPLRVLSMDSKANWLPGFLTDDEARALPLIKFFPRCGSRLYPDSVRSMPACQPDVYRGQPNVESMLDWVHAKMSAQPSDPSSASSSTPSDGAPFSLSAAHSLARSEEPATQSRVHAAMLARFAKDSADEPAIKVFELAPCAEHMTAMMQHALQRGYRSYVDEQQAERTERELYQRWQQCNVAEQERSDKFWTQVKRLADDAVEAQQDRKRQQASAGADKPQSDNTQGK